MKNWTSTNPISFLFASSKAAKPVSKTNLHLIFFLLFGMAVLSPQTVTAQCLDLTARSWCSDEVNLIEAGEFQYFIEVSAVSGGSGTYTITWPDGVTTSSFNGSTIYIGPFDFSITGGAVLVVSAEDDNNALCTGETEVYEVVCGVTPNNASTAFCDCSLNDPVGSLPAGTILAQSEPGTFEAGGTSGRIQKYLLVSNDVNIAPIGQILAVNMSGLFPGLENGDYKVYAFNYRAEDAAIIDNYLLPGQFYDVIEDGLNDIGPLADVCYAVCTSVAAEYTVDCEDLDACNAMLMECPLVFDGSQAEFDLTEADDAVACGDATGLTITYHISQMEATMDMNALGSPYTSGTIDLWVRVEDGNGCFKLALLQLVVKESPALVMSGTDEPCLGNGGSATVTVVSGPAPYTYEWSSGEMEGPTATNSHSILFVPAGTYTVSVTDGNGCLATGEYTVNSNLVVDDLSLVATGPQEAVCGDEISVEISVEDFENIGSLQFSVNWDDTQLQLLGNTPLIIDGDMPIVGPFSNEFTYTWADTDFPGYGAGLADGTTILTLNFKVLSNMASGVTVNLTGVPTSIEASNGDFCAVTVTPFNLVDFDVDKITVTCPADRSVCLEDDAFLLDEGEPGDGTFTGDGVSGDDFDPADAGAGVHVITYEGTDDDGCSNTCTFTVTVVDVEMNAIADIGPVCPEGEVGDILLSAQPFNPNIVFSWTGGAPAGLPNGNSTGLNPHIPGFTAGMTEGTWTVTVTATLGLCTDVTTFDITIGDDDGLHWVNCPANIMVGNDVDECGAYVNWTPPTAIDDCVEPNDVIVTQTMGLPLTAGSSSPLRVLLTRLNIQPRTAMAMTLPALSPSRWWIRRTRMRFVRTSAFPSTKTA